MLYGEFGIASTTQGYLDYLSDFLNLLDTYHVNWTYYSYDKTSAEAFGVLDDAGHEKESLIVLVRVHPQPIAGDHPVFQQERDAFHLNYTSNTSTAPTLVFVPPRLKGVRATFNGHPVPYDPETNLVSVKNDGTDGTPRLLHIHWE